MPEEIAVEASVLLGASDLPPELHDRMLSGEPITVVDVRREASLRADPRMIASSFHSTLDDLLDHLDDMPRANLIVFSCTCPAEESSTRAAELLIREGYRNVGVLVGGFNAWVEGGYPLDAGVALALRE